MKTEGPTEAELNEFIQTMSLKHPILSDYIARLSTQVVELQLRYDGLESKYENLKADLSILVKSHGGSSEDDVTWP